MYIIIIFSLRVTMYIRSDLLITSFFYSLTHFLDNDCFIHISKSLLCQYVFTNGEECRGIGHSTCPKDLNSRMTRSLEAFRRQKPLRNLPKTRPVRVLIRYISDLSASFLLIGISDEYVKFP